MYPPNTQNNNKAKRVDNFDRQFHHQLKEKITYKGWHGIASCEWVEILADKTIATLSILSGCWRTLAIVSGNPGGRIWKWHKAAMPMLARRRERDSFRGCTLADPTAFALRCIRTTPAPGRSIRKHWRDGKWPSGAEFRPRTDENIRTSLPIATNTGRLPCYIRGAAADDSIPGSDPRQLSFDLPLLGSKLRGTGLLCHKFSNTGKIKHSRIRFWFAFKKELSIRKVIGMFLMKFRDDYSDLSQSRQERYRNHWYENCKFCNDGSLTQAHHSSRYVTHKQLWKWRQEECHPSSPYTSIAKDTSHSPKITMYNGFVLFRRQIPAFRPATQLRGWGIYVLPSTGRYSKENPHQGNTYHSHVINCYKC